VRGNSGARQVSSQEEKCVAGGQCRGLSLIRCSARLRGPTMLEPDAMTTVAVATELELPAKSQLPFTPS
jgi:hypothetical protein